MGMMEQTKGNAMERGMTDLEFANRIADRLCGPRYRARTIRLSVLDQPPASFTTKRKNIYTKVFGLHDVEAAKAWAVAELMDRKTVFRNSCGSSIAHERQRS